MKRMTAINTIGISADEELASSSGTGEATSSISTSVVWRGA